jgi:DNA-binding ferritin-like protein
MKQIDAETLLDLQDQALKAQKGQLKNAIIKEMADKTGTPHKLLHALTQRDKSELAVKESQKHLQDIAVGDDDREDF